MGKYINVEEVERTIRNDVPLKLLMTNSLNCAVKNGIKIAEIISEKANPADVVEVVRCKDCKYRGWKQEPCHGKTVDYCRVVDELLTNSEESYCSYGERRESNDY